MSKEKCPLCFTRLTDDPVNPRCSNRSCILSAYRIPPNAYRRIRALRQIADEAEAKDEQIARLRTEREKLWGALRNACELRCLRSDQGHGEPIIDCASCRTWLANKCGLKPLAAVLKEQP